VLAKGPIGYLLPMTALGLFLMIKNYRPVPNVVQKTVEKPGLSAFLTRLDIFGVLKRILASFFVSLWQLRPLTGIAVTMAVAMPWYYLVAQRTSGEWLMTFIVDFCYRPFTQPILSHDGPFWYYLPAVLIGFFPWSVFLGPTCVDLYRRFRAHHPWSDSLVLLCCLFGSWFIFWSICSTKLPHYLLPVYPALALLTACFLDGWIAGQSQVARGWMRAAWFSSMFVGLGMTIALPIVAYLMFPGAEWIGAIGPILLFGGYLGWHFTAKENRLRAVQCYGFASIAFLTAAFGLASIGIARHQNAQPMMAAIHGDCPGDPAICEYGFHRKSTVYYAGHTIALCDTPEKLKEFLDSSERPYIITLDEYQTEIQKGHPGEFEVLTRLQRFGTVAKPIESFRARPSELVVFKRIGDFPKAQISRKTERGKSQ
jgi:4-amino-4-deoxy-L-arabinose transferase-like glycosyltransferase